MKEISRNLIAKFSLRSIFIIIGLGALVFLLLFRLTDLLPGLSPAEVTTRYFGPSYHYLLHNPINAPYQLLAYGLARLMPHSMQAIRLVSAFFGAATVMLFFYIVRCWFNPTVALLSGLMFASSTWFLRSARQGTPDVLLFGLLLFIAINLWLRRFHHRRLFIALMGLAACFSLYIPGLIWFLIIAAVWKRHLIKTVLQLIKLRIILIISVAGAVIVAPLLWATANNYKLVWSILGLPSRVPALLPTLKHLTDVPLNLFVRGPYQPGFWVGRSPVLDVFEVALVVFGIYAYWLNRHLTHLFSLLIVFLITTVLVSLGGPVTLSLVLPFIYLSIASGLAYLFNDWFSTFPRNPIARGVGVTLVVLVVCTSCFYQLDRYFIAWPHTPPAKATFSYRPTS
jgi:hypothetical protein